MTAAGAGNQVARRGHQFVQAQEVYVVDGRCDQPSRVERDGEADVHRLLDLMAIINPKAVQFRHLRKRALCRGPGSAAVLKTIGYATNLMHAEIMGWQQ